MRKFFLGSELSGELNFVRRTNSAYFAAAVYKIFKNFGRQVQDSLKERNITAPVHVLKADGGTLPLDIALKQPVETSFYRTGSQRFGYRGPGRTAGEKYFAGCRWDDY